MRTGLQTKLEGKGETRTQVRSMGRGLQLTSQSLLRVLDLLLCGDVLTLRLRRVPRVHLLSLSLQSQRNDALDAQQTMVAESCRLLAVPNLTQSVPATTR